MLTCRLPAWIVVAFVLCSAQLGAQDRETLIDWILEDPAWNLQTEPVHYTADDIEILAENNTSNVLEYGLIGASQFELASSGQAIEVTLYEMIDSTASYGLFALDRDWRSSAFELAVVGTESYRIPNTLVFWQSKYVVWLEGRSEPTAALGEWIADNIVGQSRKAPVSRLLPAQGLVRESEKYILTPAAFQSITALDPTELGFDNSVEVSVAEYRQAAGSGMLALLLYPTLQLARIHAEAWLETPQGDLPSSRSGPLFAILFESDSDELSETILSALGYQSEVTWTETLPDPLTLPELILTIFTFIGFALGLTLLAGLFFGGFRIYMNAHYPNVNWGKGQEVEFIQLKLNQRFTGKELNS